MEGDGITGRRREDAQEEGGSSAKRLKCSIDSDAFTCDACARPLRPPIFLCSDGHFCSSCCRRDDNELSEGKCCFASGCSGTLARNHGMERAVQSILVDCGPGCTEKTTYHDIHRSTCPHAPCECPEPGCGFAGSQAELRDHLTGGHHRWPSTAFRYWVPFDLRVAEPGSRVLHCEDDGQIVLVSVQPAAQPHGYAVSLVRVQYIDPKVTGCSVSFSRSPRHRSTSTVDIWPFWYVGYNWPPKKYVCFVPKSSDGADDAGIVLTINIAAYFDAADDEDDDPDDGSYVESEADDDGESS